MFGRKKTIQMNEITDHLIESVSGGPFKKKSMIDIPKGYEVVLIEADGTTEIIRNQHQYKLDRDVHAIFYAKTNALVQKTKWGTPSRIAVKTADGGTQNLGAHGVLSFTLANPLRYLNKRMNTEDDLAQEALKSLVTDKMTDIMRSQLERYKAVDPEKTSELTKALQTDVAKALNSYLDDFGIQVDDLTIESITIQ